MKIFYTNYLNALPIELGLFGILVFFTHLHFMEFRVTYLAIFHLSSVIDSFEWPWTESHLKRHYQKQSPVAVLGDVEIIEKYL